VERKRSQRNWEKKKLITNPLISIFAVISLNISSTFNYGGVQFQGRSNKMASYWEKHQTYPLEPNPDKPKFLHA